MGEWNYLRVRNLHFKSNFSIDSHSSQGSTIIGAGTPTVKTVNTKRLQFDHALTAQAAGTINLLDNGYIESGTMDIDSAVEIISTDGTGYFISQGMLNFTASGSSLVSTVLSHS